MNQKVQNVLRKTFGGLKREYLIRQYFFAIMFAVAITMFLTWAEQEATKDPDAGMTWTFYFFLVVDTILYPYSRWVYETVLGFILGRNLFIAPLDTFFLVKLFTMAICFGLAIWIAPIGLMVIYIYHTVQEKKNLQ